MITNNFAVHFVGGQAEQKENKRLINEGQQLSFFLEKGNMST